MVDAFRIFADEQYTSGEKGKGKIETACWKIILLFMLFTRKL
jgi:hypothetical protein